MHTNISGFLGICIGSKLVYNILCQGLKLTGGRRRECILVAMPKPTYVYSPFLRKLRMRNLETDGRVTDGRIKL